MEDIKNLFTKMRHLGQKLPEKQPAVRQRKLSLDLETYLGNSPRKLDDSCLKLVTKMSDSTEMRRRRAGIHSVSEDSMDDGIQDNEIRLAVVGTERCGKSALTVRFLTKRFIGEYDSCCDARFQREIFIADNRILLDVKDTSKMFWIDDPKNLINWASAIVVVYSVTSRKSFHDAERILQLIHESKPLEPGCTLLMGNKSDLRHLRQVTPREGKRLSIHYGVRFNESSAAENYENVYNTIMKLLIEALVVEKAKQHSFCRRISLSSEHISSDNGSPRNTIKQFVKDTFSSVVLSPRLSRRTVTI